MKEIELEGAVEHHARWQEEVTVHACQSPKFALWEEREDGVGEEGGGQPREVRVVDLGEARGMV